MFRFALILTLIGVAVSAPQISSKNKFRPMLKSNSYSIEGIVGGESQARNNPDQVHIRVAPQDPVVVAGEYGGDFLQEAVKKTTTTSKTSTTTTTPAPYNEDFERRPAHYSFDASVQDDINDHSHIRTETRDGLKTTGMYSYSDGFYLRSVHYIADENGYRIVKQDVKKIGDGPVFNARGRADVSGSLIGQYSVVIGKEKDQPNYVEPHKLN